MSTTNDSMHSFISNLISSCRLDSTYALALTDPLSIRLYQKAFTHVSFDPYNNYEVYEQLGDITVNKFLVWYFYQRFPSFHSTYGVKIVARLRIKYGSKQFLCSLAEKLGFWQMIRVAEAISPGKRMSILEDVFEAFIGVTEYIIDQRMHLGLGYMCCYKMLKSWLDVIPIDISYEQLFDAKTRLKELFDINKDTLGNVSYDYEKQLTGESIVRIYRILGREKVYLSSGKSLINKANAEQEASEEAIQVLAKQGFVREIPHEYKKLVQAVIN
jgi:dsRNA-specific ribonuclease